MEVLLVTVVLVAVLGAAVHRATWVADEAVRRARALELPKTDIAAVRPGRTVRIAGVVVGPATGEALRAPVSQRACVAASLESDGLAPTTSAVDFVLESDGARARVEGARLELGISGQLHHRVEGSGRLDSILRAGGAERSVRTAIERTLEAGRRVEVIGAAVAREPDPDGAPHARGDGYRELVRPTRVVVSARGMAVLVIDPPSPEADALRRASGSRG